MPVQAAPRDREKFVWLFAASAKVTARPEDLELFFPTTVRGDSGSVPENVCEAARARVARVVRKRCGYVGVPGVPWRSPDEVETSSMASSYEGVAGVPRKSPGQLARTSMASSLPYREAGSANPQCEYGPPVSPRSCGTWRAVGLRGIMSDTKEGVNGVGGIPRSVQVPPP